MQVQYLEIVTKDVDAVCANYAQVHGVSFSDPDAGLGNARTAALPDGGMIGVRAPMHEIEEPIVRPYWLVDDVAAAVEAAAATGAEIAHPPMELPGHGTFAIYIQGGIHHGLWHAPVTYLKSYAGVIISFLLIDAGWIILVAKPLYERTVGGLMRESPNLLAAGIFYLVYAAGIVFLASKPAVDAQSAATALINGAVLGGLAYGTFTITNFALLKGWTTGLVISDILWGIILTAVTAWIGYLAGRL